MPTLRTQERGKIVCNLESIHRGGGDIIFRSLNRQTSSEAFLCQLELKMSHNFFWFSNILRYDVTWTLAPHLLITDKHSNFINYSLLLVTSSNRRHRWTNHYLFFGRFILNVNFNEMKMWINKTLIFSSVFFAISISLFLRWLVNLLFAAGKVSFIKGKVSKLFF